VYFIGIDRQKANVNMNSILRDILKHGGNIFVEMMLVNVKKSFVSQQNFEQIF